MSDESRFGDGKQVPPERASTRVFHDETDGKWYFTTREGKSMGPFDTEDEAGVGLSDFLEFMRLADLQTLATMTRSLTPDDELDDRLDEDEL